MRNVIQMLRPNRGWALAAIACVFVAASPAEAQLVVYDEFGAPRIDESKWAGRQFVTRDGGTGALLEIQREVTAAQALVLQARAIGGRSIDGGRFSAENALAFRHANALSDIAFAVWVRRLDVAGCASGAESSAAARGVFALFNDGTGDVVAIVEVGRSSASAAAAGALDVVATLVHRTADGENVLGSISLGSAALAQRVRLRVRWEEANNRVRFQRDADALAAIDYTNAVVNPPGAPRKYLGALSSVGDCAGADATAHVIAAFDNVRVNQ